MWCVHCQDRPAVRARGLCSACYYQPHIRQRYPITTVALVRHSTEGEPMERGEAEPTDALPGTPAKIEVMAERYERRQSLFHPGDRREE
jgi:hypothetical protein